MVYGDRPLTSQRLGGCLPFPHRDCPDCSPVSQGGGLDGIPGPPGYLPPGSGASIFSPVPEVLHGGVGLPVLRPLLRPVDGSSGVYPCHGPCLLDYASSRVLDPPVSRQLAGPGFILPGDCAGEGLPPLALLSTRYPDQSSQELLGSESDSGLSRDDNLDFSFEGFPNPPNGSAIVTSAPGVSLQPPTSCVRVASPPRSNVLVVGSGSGFSPAYEVPSTSSFSINHQELLAVLYAVQGFLPSLRGRVVVVYFDNTTTLAYLQKQGGTRSSTLNAVAQSILRLCESNNVRLLPQFILGRLTVLVNSLSRRSQVLGFEWTLCPEALRELLCRWPSTIDLFVMSLNHRLPVYFSLMIDPQSAGTDAMLQLWDGLQASVFPPFGLLP